MNNNERVVGRCRTFEIHDLSCKKKVGVPSRKDCPKSFDSAAAQGGYRIKLRPMWAGGMQRRPPTQALPNFPAKRYPDEQKTLLKSLTDNHFELYSKICKDH